MAFDSCPTLGSEEDCLQNGSECLSADVGCELCDVQGVCDDTVIGMTFVDNRDDCVQECQGTQVLK